MSTSVNLPATKTRSGTTAKPSKVMSATDLSPAPIAVGAVIASDLPPAPIAVGATIAGDLPPAPIAVGATIAGDLPPAPIAVGATIVSDSSCAPIAVGATVATDQPLAPLVDGANIRHSPAAAASQDCVFQAMLKRIAALEDSLKLAQRQSNGHQSSDALSAGALNIASASHDNFVNGAAITARPQFMQLSSPTIASAFAPALPSQIESRSQTEPRSQIEPRLHIESRSPMFSTPAAAVPTVVSSGVATNTCAQVSRKIQDLPEFSGKPEDWPIFYTAFMESSAAYGYSCYENNCRLQKCLKGEAREVVKSLLIHPNNVGHIIEQLKFRFGRPEQLIRSQLAQVREISPIAESAVTKLIPFATKVNNICAFLLSTSGGEQHVVNPTLLDELVAKLPMSKRIEWAVFAASVQPYATVRHFSDWLNRLANVICTVYDGDAARDSKRRVVLHAAEPQRQPRCPICQGQHKSAACKLFLDLPIASRWTEAKRRRLCFGCLNAGHGARNCQRRKPCDIDGCRRMHHKLLHDIEGGTSNLPAQPTPPHECARQDHVADPRGRSLAQELPPPRSQQSREAGAAVLNCSTNSAESELLFRVLPVLLYGNNKTIETYALLDEGSSITMVDNALLQELGVCGQQKRLNLQWFGGRAAHEPAVVVDLFVSGIGMQKKHKLRNVYGLSNLELPTQSLSKADLSCHDTYMCKLPVQPYAGVKPKLLIGLDHCHLGLPSTTMKINKCGPFAAKTELGWVVFGPTTNTKPFSPSCLLMNHHSDQSLQNMVADYFDTESFGVKPSPPIESEADARARAILQSTTCRVDGRYQTGLIWRRDNVELPDSYTMAARRLVSIERKMSRNAEFATEYKRIMDSYVVKNYARKLPPEEAVLTSPRTWYLPHFAVSNPNKPGKLRMVFDAAAQVDGVSLNSQLLKGPQEYRPLPAILFHFREGAVAVCGDIREMFHQVLIRQQDRCAQRFLWRGGDATKQPEVYEMQVMTFGAACSPCAANYVKTLNALEQRSDADGTTRAVKSILDYHYVDDLVESFHSEEEAIIVTQKVRAIHMNAGFELRGFASNSPKVLAALDGNDLSRPIVSKEGSLTERVLGLFWQPTSDSFEFKLKFSNVETTVVSGARRPTKRELLSIIMSIFDPLGLLSNFIIAAKLLMREVWRHDIRWDEPLPTDVKAAWERWRKQLPAVAEFAMPRYYFRKGPPQKLQLHVFVDASEEAFAAVAYWRATNSMGETEVAFICAKSRCAPVKPLTVPRLELQAAVLGARLAGCVREEHSVDIENCVIWSDSSTVIKWIRSEHRRYKPFVQHRVAEILATTTTSNWRWLPTEHNVADEATRANKRVDFSPTARWSCGPHFLHQEECEWPSDAAIAHDQEVHDEELRPKYSLVIANCEFLNFNRFSSFTKLVRATAWVLRFINACRRRVESDQGYGLSARELEETKRRLCRLVQRESFTEEFQQLENGQDVARTSALRQLSPYIDEDGVLRVQGRIDAASWLPMSARHPIILPTRHAFTELVVMHFHNKMRHQNSEAAICEIRRSYWVPRLRNVLRSVIARCLVCRVNKVNAVAPLMGPLPVDRLTPYVRPFSFTGMDYFGPINVTIRRSSEKRWVALFTCLTVRAVHLELAHDLSTDACIVVIRNFINRRGVPLRIRSDNGKNFVGTDREAKRFSEVFDCHRLQSELSQKGIEWVFNSPFNPAEGGAWERLVQCVKRVLRQTLKETAPREHTLNCFLIEAESVVNSRPLTHLPVDVNQEQPLTPNDFLLGEANTAQTPIADDVLEKICILRKQWRIARQLRDHFWKRWIMEYLPTLTRRVKWCRRTKPLQVGDLVFICDPNVPRREWRRGKIEAVYPGADGEVRRADVRTTSGLKRRAASKLAVLDVDIGESG